MKLNRFYFTKVMRYSKNILSKKLQKCVQKKGSQMKSNADFFILFLAF